jgi:tetratricopeptide (TPR) repeat protein
MPSVAPPYEDVLSLAADVEEQLLGEGHPSQVARLESLGPRLGEALDFGAEHDPERTLALAAGLWRFWVLTGEVREGRQHLRWLLSLVPTPSPTRLRGLTSSAILASFAGQHAEAAGAAEEALPLARALDDDVRLGYLAWVLAWNAQSEGDVRTAAAHLKEALERFRDTQHRWGTATVLLGLGEVARSQGDAGRAQPLYAEGLAIFEQLKDDSAIAASHVNLGLVFVELGHLGEASAHLTEAARAGEAHENRALLAHALLGLAALRRLEGRREAATRLLGEAQGLLEAAADCFEAADLRLAEREEAELRRALGPAYEAEWQHGQKVPRAEDRVGLAR